MSILRATLLFLSLALAGCATTPEPAGAPPPVVASGPGFVERSLSDGRAIIGAQPAAADFDALREAGVTRVFNLRAAEEMSALGFDEAASATAAGMRYLHSPVAGASGFTPAVLQAFAQEMAGADDGRLLLHCASGSRAGQLYAAWLVKYRGRTPDQAMRQVAPLGLWPLPMERMLERELSLQFTDPVGSDSFEQRGD